MRGQAKREQEKCLTASRFAYSHNTLRVAHPRFLCCCCRIGDSDGQENLLVSEIF